MDNQLAQPKDVARKLIIAGISIALIVCAIVVGLHINRLSDPYMQKVLELQGDVERGNAIFQINCAGCHGWQAYGNVGPSLQDISKHKSKVSLINQVISGKTPPMPKFQPSPQEMADLLSYLERL